MSKLRATKIKGSTVDVQSINQSNFLQWPKWQQTLQCLFVCLFAWGLMALSAQIGYIVP